MQRNSTHLMRCRALLLPCRPGLGGYLLAQPLAFMCPPALSWRHFASRELAEESGIEHWGRVPALNTNPTFIDDLADAVAEALPYVGSLQRSAGASITSSLTSSDSLVPLGECKNNKKLQPKLQPEVLPRLCCWCCSRASATDSEGDGREDFLRPRPKTQMRRAAACSCRIRAPLLLALSACLPVAELCATASVRAAHRRVRQGWLSMVLQLAARFNTEGPL